MVASVFMLAGPSLSFASHRAQPIINPPGGYAKPSGEWGLKGGRRLEAAGAAWYVIRDSRPGIESGKKEVSPAPRRTRRLWQNARLGSWPSRAEWHGRPRAEDRLPPRARPAEVGSC